MVETEKATSPLTCSLPIVMLNIEKSVADKLKVTLHYTDR